jgi:hypothetical protein
MATVSPAGAQDDVAEEVQPEETSAPAEGLDREEPKVESTETAPATDEDKNAEQAKAEFALGNEAYEARNYRKAAEAFERAHALAPHSAVLFNAAKAWWKVGELERAADDYAEAIQRGELVSEQTLRARGALARLRKKLGWVVIRGSDEMKVSLGYHDESELPLVTHLAPGDHMLDVTEGTQAWRQIISIQADAPLSVVPQPGAATNANTPEPVDETDPPPSSSGRETRKVLGFVALGTGSALGIGAAVTGAMTMGAVNDFEESGNTSQADHDKAKTLKTVTNVLALSGAALGITGFTLLVTLPSKKLESATLGHTKNESAVKTGTSLGLNLRPDRVSLIGRF